MPGFSKQTAPTVEDFGPVEDRYDDVLGYRIDFLHFRPEMDSAPMLKGLPDDRCIAPHWGYVLKGAVTYRFADHSETYRAGDAFYVPAGHTPFSEADTEYLQFSPSEELKIVSETILRNFEAMQASA
jgi:hypothetical protein